MKHFFMSLIAVVVLVVLFAIAYWLNLPGVHTFLGAANDALTEIFGALFVGLKLLFFTGLVLGIAYAVIELRKRSRITVISGTKHRPAQAIIHKGELVQLAQPGQQQLDPLQQLAVLQKVIQMQGQMAKLAQQTYVQEIAPAQPRELAAPQERIPAVVKYEDIASEIPGDLSLLGIHPSDGNFEIVPPEKLKTVWFVGGSNTGKTNTVYGKVGDCVRWGCKISICDQHAHKRDSLAGKLGPYAKSFLHIPAISDDEIKDAILNFLEEFHRRRKGGKYTDKRLIVVDEVNGLGEHVVRVTKEEAELIYMRYGVEIKKERVKMRVFIQLLVETCGYESRGYDMFGFFISQKAADLSWLRKAAMTVFVHGLLMKSEALLACNDNAEAAALVMNFKKGRTYIFGYEIERPMELQQPLYGDSVVDATITPVTENLSSEGSSSNQTVITPEDGPEVATEGRGRTDDIDYSFELKKILREAGRLRSQGVATDAILKQLGLKPGGRNNQDLQAVLDMIEQAE